MSATSSTATSTSPSSLVTTPATPSSATAPGSSPATTVSSSASPASSGPEQNAPVDLGTTSKPQPLRIPTVPAPMRPPPRASGITALSAVRGGQTLTTRPAALLAVPKAGTTAGQVGQVNLAVMQSQQAATVASGAPQSVNKVTVLTSTTPPAKAGTPLTAPVPRATATTIVRPPTSQFPVSIRTPSSASSPAIGTTSIRLTTTGSGAAAAGGAAGAGGQPVQFVPVSLSTTTLRPQAGTAAPGTASINVRPGTVAGAINVRPAGAGFRPATSISDAVRVTLVQSPAGAGVSRANNPGAGGATLTPTGASGFYKPVTISTGQPKLSPTGQPVRIGPVPTATRMTVVPAGAAGTGPSGATLQTVNLAPTSHINVPLAPNVLTSGGKGGAGATIQGRAIPAGKIITAAATSQAGVTIQKTGTAAVTVSQPGPGGNLTQPRTISLPYGATQVAAISKPISQAIPVARVVPQPLTSATSGGAGGANLVTITTTQAPPTGSIATVATGVPQPGSVYIARAGSQTLQPVAINLTSTTVPGGSQQPPSISLTSKIRGATLTQQSISLPTQPARLVSLQQPAVQQQQQQQQQALEAGGHDMARLIPSSPRPSILRRREGDRDHDTPPPRPDSRNDDAGSSSSGSTTLSATSSPGIAGEKTGNLSGGEEPNLQPSPRKKPRKQTLTSNVRGGPAQWPDDEFQSSGDPSGKRKIPAGSSLASGSGAGSTEPAGPVSHYIGNRPPVSLLNSYRHTWKSRHNHFLKHSDVRPREDVRPTVNDLANQKQVMQKINGWKIYHLASQMEDIMDVEAELTSRFSSLQKRLDKHSLPEIAKDVGKAQELIKANLQRSKVIQTQMQESKDHALELFDHKSRVSEILLKYASKRQVKKRDLKI